MMYEFYYDYLKPKYLDRCKLLFVDTDSFCCHIQTEDLYHDMSENIELFDSSNFGKTRPLYTKTNHRIAGKFKSETGSLAPIKCVGLRAKMYSLFVPHNFKECKIRAKGIKKSYIKKNTINFSTSSKRWNPLLAPSVPFSPQITSCGLLQLIKPVLMLLMINDIFYRMALSPLHAVTSEFPESLWKWIELYCMFWHGLLFEHCRAMYMKMNCAFDSVFYVSEYYISLHSNIDVVSRRLLLYFKPMFDWTFCLWIKWIIVYTFALVLKMMTQRMSHSNTVPYRKTDNTA